MARRLSNLILRLQYKPRLSEGASVVQSGGRFNEA